MKQIMSPLARAALSRAINAARVAPVQRPKYESRSAAKYVIRGYEELFVELRAIGSHQGRSMNSEVVAAFLEALAGHQRSQAMLTILKGHLGENIASSVLSTVRDFDITNCVTKKQFVVRCPPDVRNTIRDGVSRATGGGR
ncbi:Arc family DNA-binding protein [Pseudomonas tritici]|uniref:Arc family DNA-binding protein n=1 Tax=Pseudomonas tritici TaxID=2745518 RepID=UPI00387B2BC4